MLFLPTLTPKRSEFFANDVIFLDDMPRSALSDRFCELTKEFVGNFGGGLVVISGPRFGPGELGRHAAGRHAAGDRRSRAESSRPTTGVPPRAHAARGHGIRSCSSAPTHAENDKAWKNLGKLPWYQPVARCSRAGRRAGRAPEDKCADGKTPQPLIAIRHTATGMSSISASTRSGGCGGSTARSTIASSGRR